MSVESIVYVVDDDASVRKSLCWLLDAANYTTQTFACAQEFLESYDPLVVGCLLLDVRMPGANGLELQATLEQRQIEIPIIFISGHVDVRMASEAFRAGACDVLTKPVDVDLLLARIDEAFEKDCQRYLKSCVVEEKQQLFSLLTPKERQVFSEMLKGLTIKQLATRFRISFQTAAKHRSRIMCKLQVETDVQLIREFQNIIKD